MRVGEVLPGCNDLSDKTTQKVLQFILSQLLWNNKPLSPEKNQSIEKNPRVLGDMEE